MKKFKMGIVVALAISSFMFGEVTQASDDYTPTVTITKYLNNDGSNTEQQLLPVEGVKFSIQKVLITPSGLGDVDPQDPSTYSVNVDTEKPVYLTGTTDVNGKIFFEGADKLPEGTYELIEDGVSNKDGKVIFSLPYVDETGKVKDDVSLVPKSGVIEEGGEDGGKDTNPNIIDKNPKPQKPAEKPAQKPSEKPDKIMQMSGELLAIPWKTMFAISFGLLFLVGGLFLRFKKEKEKKNNLSK